jgi:hypothetical protein
MLSQKTADLMNERLILAKKSAHIAQALKVSDQEQHPRALVCMHYFDQSSDVVIGAFLGIAETMNPECGPQ